MTNREYKQTPIGLIPTEWKLATIDDFGEVVTGSTPPTNDNSNFGNDYMFVSPSDLGGNKYVRNSERGITAKGLEKCRALPPGSVLFVSIGSTIGKTGITTEISATNQQINAVIPNELREGAYLLSRGKYVNLSIIGIVPLSLPKV